MLLLAALLCAGAPTTWAELEKDLPKERAKKAVALSRFAHDQKVVLADRIKASDALSSILTGDDGSRRVDADLLAARLAAAAGKSGAHRAALERASAHAKRAHLDDRAAHIDAAAASEGAVSRLAASVAKGKPGSDDDVNHIQKDLSAFLAIGDECGHARARIVLAERTALTDVDAGLRVMADAIDAVGSDVDCAQVRADAWTFGSKLNEQAGKYDEAAADALAADHALHSVPSASTTSSSYTRTKSTSSLCARARAKGVSCAKIEKQRFNEHTFFDFSTERGTSFNAARADDVLGEFAPLIEDCLQKGAKANLTTNTHVELEWSVNNNGHVLPAFDLRPMRLRGSLVESCLGEAFATFRYPTYKGEMQHVRLSFDVGE